MKRLFAYLTGRARKFAISELVVLAALGTALSDVSPGGARITTAEWITLGIAQLGAIGVHQVPNTPAPPVVDPSQMPMTVALLPEVSTPDRKLGRHVEHDPRSKAYPAKPPKVPLVSKRWARQCRVLNQQATGSCTGNAAAGWRGTDTAARPGLKKITESIARTLYSEATALDSIPGTWPPTDTGSSGLAAAKALVKSGYATAYTHCFDTATVLATLAHVGPVMIGSQWRTGMDSPNANGQIRYAGAVRGGHEYLLDEIDVANQLVWLTNSWGLGYGIKGRACMSWADLKALLADSGDATVPA